jgi:hypothetical protein
MSATCAARTIAAISFGNVTKRSFESGAVCSNDATNATRPSRSGRTSASSRNVSSAPVRRSVNEGSGDAAAVDRHDAATTAAIEARASSARWGRIAMRVAWTRAGALTTICLLRR